MDTTFLPDEERRSGDLSWRYLDVELNPANYVEDFRTKLLPKVRPHWVPDNLEYKIFEEGVTNMLVGVYEKSRKDDTILLRFNGKGTEYFINREQEIFIMLVLSKEGLCPPVYRQLKNGLCYGFAVGRHLTVEEMRSEIMMEKIAKTVARLHAVTLPQELKGRKPQIWVEVDEWLEKIPSRFSDHEKQSCFEREIGSVGVLRQEVDRLKSELSKCNSPIRLCHNDIMNRNIIYNEKDGSVVLIDFEYSGPNYCAFDLGDHFCEFAGLENTDYKWYPGEETQKRWIRFYLRESTHLSGSDPNSVTEEAVHTLYREANKFALAAHMMWCLWALLQAQHSTIDNFNYMEYAGIRFAEFRRRKEEFYAL